MKDTRYFQHDYNAQHDPKIVRLLQKVGWEGYGLYWAVVEDLYNNGGKIPCDLGVLAYKYRAKEESIKAVINDFGLFTIKEDAISSVSVNRRLADRNDRIEAARKNGLASWKSRQKKSAEISKELNDRSTTVQRSLNYKEIKKGGCATPPGRFPPNSQEGRLINPSWLLCQKCSKKHDPHVECETGFMLPSHHRYNS